MKLTELINNRSKERQSEPSLFEMLTDITHSEAAASQCNHNENQHFIVIDSPFGQALKPVDAQHPSGLTKKQHALEGNTTYLIANEEG